MFKRKINNYNLLISYLIGFFWAIFHLRLIFHYVKSISLSMSYTKIYAHKWWCGKSVFDFTQYVEITDQKNLLKHRSLCVCSVMVTVVMVTYLNVQQFRQKMAVCPVFVRSSDCLSAPNVIRMSRVKSAVQSTIVSVSTKRVRPTVYYVYDLYRHYRL